MLKMGGGPIVGMFSQANASASHIAKPGLIARDAPKGAEILAHLQLSPE